MAKRETVDILKITKKLKTFSKTKKSCSLPEGLTDSEISLTDYYVENGLQKVYPYFYTFHSYCKGRWIGRKLLDVYQNEFRLFSLQEYINKAENGFLTVNNKKISLDYVLQSNDTLQSLVHRHETPVLPISPKILVNNNDYVVVDKPSSIPVHPCGNFRYNSLTSILAKNYDINNLYSMHRIDRLTSGLVIFAKNINAFNKIQSNMLAKTTLKEYLCLVEGIFPEHMVICDKRLKIFSFKIGISAVVNSNEEDDDKNTVDTDVEKPQTGKEAKTTFQRIALVAYIRDSKKSSPSNSSNAIDVKIFSLVKCQPLTGRTHQIRVHAQYLGHPIINDPLYNTVLGWGPEKGRNAQYNGRTINQVVRDLIVSGNYDLQSKLRGNDDPETTPENGKDVDNDNCNEINEETIEKPFWYEPSCYECRYEIKKLRSKTYETPSNDKNVKKSEYRFEYELPMYLHCFRYSGDDWTFQTQIPTWANTPNIGKFVDKIAQDLKNDNHTDNIIDTDTENENFCFELLHPNYTHFNAIIDALQNNRDAINYNDTQNVYIYDDTLKSQNTNKNEIVIYPENYNSLLRHLCHKN